MRCKKGDLCVYVGTVEVLRWRQVVRCVSVSYERGEREYVPGMYWLVEPPLLDDLGVPREYVADAALLPIRDPGDDAQDETLSWLPVPLPELVS